MNCERCGKPRPRIKRKAPAFLGGGEVDRFGQCPCVDPADAERARAQRDASMATAKRRCLDACGVAVKPSHDSFKTCGRMTIRKGLIILNPTSSATVVACTHAAMAIVWGLASNGQRALYASATHEDARLWTTEEQRGLLRAPVLALSGVGMYDPAPWVKGRVLSVLQARVGQVTVCALGVPRQTIEERWGVDAARWLFDSAVSMEMV